LFIALVFFASSMLFTASIVRKVRLTIEEAAGRELDLFCSDIKNSILARLDTNAQILRGGAALINATGTVDREAWREFSQSLHLENNYPGIQGVGFSILVPASGLEAHVRELRSQGFPGYAVFPMGERSLYSSIVYLEPFAERNLRAFGYDMFSEPVRRTAMERSRDENKPALSGKVILMQETTDEIQSGTLLYVPVYRHGELVETVEQRRHALIGWVYSPYRMTDLMRGTLRNELERFKSRNMYLQIFDGNSSSNQDLLFDSRGSGVADSEPGSSTDRIVTLETAGRLWTLRFVQSIGLTSSTDRPGIRYMQFGGTIISLLLFGLVLNLVLTRERAQRMALNLTSELQKSESRLREVLENSLHASYKRNLRSNTYEYLSPVFYRLTGLTPEEMITMSLENVLLLMHPEDRAGVACQFSEAMKGRTGGSYTIEYRFMHKERRYVWLKDQFLVMKDPDGIPLACIGSISDITDLKDTAETLLLVTKRMESIIEGTNVGTWEWNVQTGALQIGEKWARLIGYSLEELDDIDIHTWERYVHPDDFNTSNQALQRHFSGELPFYDIECRMKHRDGRWIWVHTRGSVQMRSGDGKPLMMYGTHSDITKRKLAEAELEKSYGENKALLAELQHRVKNSFSMISSMICRAN